MDHDAVLRDVVAWATDEPNVRLVVVTGSYARGETDELSDLDIELYLTDPGTLLDDDEWYERFGRVLVTERLDNEGWHPTRLVHYVDGKIDFTIAPVTAARDGVGYDEPYTVALDKDGLSGGLHAVERVAPDSAEFQRCVEWFYAAAIMCAKSLARGDLWPAKVRDAELKAQLLTMIEWNRGVRHGWHARVGHNGAGIERWGDDDIAAQVSANWAGWSVDSSREALRASKRLFDRLAEEVGSRLEFDTAVVGPASAEVDRLVSIAMPTEPQR